ncbi:MAG TPA: hypothetical protein VHZ77_04810 [Gaiellaceae bacterium]|nr:hypothetical protein [Gaiellaceae bacterium]
MKRYFLSVAAALAVALAGAGGALAKGPARPVAGPGHGLIPSFAPHPGFWLRALREFPRNPSPPKPKSARRLAPKRQPQSPPRLRATTLSIYEHSAQPWILAAQGCSAAKRHESGIVILDFGKPAFERGGYGTLLFSGRFAKNHKITAAMLGYANGYVSCLPQNSTASIEIARGTSNYHPAVPSAYTAGVRWGRETNELGQILAEKGLSTHVEAAAADDAEPAWDPEFHKTRDFFHGFRAAVHGHTLYDYGSLDGGVGAVWSARQAWYVAGAIRHTKALPEIYNSAMAREWAELARIGRGRYHRGVHFAGVMTQGAPSCNCGLRPTAAHRVLAQALDSQGVGHVPLPPGGTNIVG